MRTCLGMARISRTDRQCQAKWIEVEALFISLFFSRPYKSLDAFDTTSEIIAAADRRSGSIKVDKYEQEELS